MAGKKKAPAKPKGKPYKDNPNDSPAKERAERKAGKRT